MNFNSQNITEIKVYELCRSTVISKGKPLEKAGRFWPSREPQLLFYILSPGMNSLWPGDLANDATVKDRMSSRVWMEQ